MFGMLSLLSLFRCYLMRNGLSPAFCSLPSLCFPLRRFQKPSFLSPHLPSSPFHPRLHHPLILPGAAARSGLPDPDRGNFFLPSTSFLSLIHLIFLPVAASNQTVKVPPPPLTPPHQPYSSFPRCLPTVLCTVTYHSHGHLWQTGSLSRLHRLSGMLIYLIA